MRLQRIFMGVFLFSAVVPAMALACEISSTATHGNDAGSLHGLLSQVQSSGACRTEAVEMISQYKPYLHMASAVQLIEWTRSMDLYLDEPLPPLHGYQGEPLVLLARPGVHVRIIGNRLQSGDAIHLSGGTAPTILDGLTLQAFPGIALEIASDRNAIIRTRILESGKKVSTTDPLALIPGVRIRGRQTHIVESEIAQHRGAGVVITEEDGSTGCSTPGYRHGEATHVVESEIHHNGDVGVVINAFDGTVRQSAIYQNGGDGLRVISESREVACAAKAGDKVSPILWHAVLVQETRFWKNGGEAGQAIAVTSMPLPPPVDLIVVSPETAPELIVIGNISRFPDPAYLWGDAILNFDTIHLELFVSDGGAHGQGEQFLQRVDAIDPLTRQFIAHIPQAALAIAGQSIEHLQLTATLVDEEYGNTSPFSLPLDVQATIDWDGDGLPNAQEDHNHDGLVDVAETDPRLADTDGDGLTDGEELLLIGHVATVTSSQNAAPVIVSHPQLLDPRNPDSDGDCLPDGLEMRVGQEDLPPWAPTPGSVLARPRLVFSARCLQQFRDHQLVAIDNGVPWDPTEAVSPENLMALFDTDPATWTDPTDGDTDDDGMTDGEEDWNIDGARTPETQESGAVDVVGTLVQGEPVWQETDPNDPDSDGDGVLDGDEGDRDQDGVLGVDESDPLHVDSDGDGVSDAEERQRGTHPNDCDSDKDGLADGLELGVINPHPAHPLCRGLQSAGTNFDTIGALDPRKIDSDNDGRSDGEEDANQNGWLDDGETDPTTPDTDGDGIPDAIEVTGDLDQDGIVDVMLGAINNGGSCAPPPTMADVDCDGMPNANDTDSDNDGCSDAEEGLLPKGDPAGVPAAYHASVKACGGATAPAPPGGGGSVPVTEPPPTAEELALEADTAARTYYSRQVQGGGSCALLPRSRERALLEVDK